ncbi:hypothetical protein O6H91_17G081800 [Diphasiastrum complanatum]|uniref:Uncharacterized protein n=1 Tax=Diphasiastrum complanatum TaxID=34168 RepID=A0ACC2B8P5_DIPCM|nr:hypothetical protein O6H91_17G081800 [Diphasiastrum complanatum]
MFPLEWNDMDIISWERKWCPWWLDYPVGQVPPYERDLHVRRQAMIQGKRQNTQEPEQGSTSKRKVLARQRRPEQRSRRLLVLEDEEDLHDSYMLSSDDTPVDAAIVDYVATSLDTPEALQGKVCAVLCDIRKIARKKKSSAAKKVREFCTHNLATGLTINKIPAPFWNEFYPDLAATVFEIASFWWRC